MKNKLTFEGALKRLEEISAILDSAEKPLDETVKLYEEGMNLLKYCNEKLSEAEKKVKVISENMSGTIVTENFNPEQDVD